MCSSPLIELLEAILRVLTLFDALNGFFWIPSARLFNSGSHAPPHHIDESVWVPRGASGGCGMFLSTGFRRSIEARAIQLVPTRYHKEQS